MSRVFPTGQAKVQAVQLSDLETVELLVSSPAQENEDQSMVALLEIKNGEYPIITGKPFSQLMHAAALAYNSGKWQSRLLCCMASLKFWHLFMIEVCSSESGKHFAVTSYWKHFVTGPLVDSYTVLVQRMALLLLNL